MNCVCYALGHDLVPISDEVSTCKRCKENYTLHEIVRQFVVNGHLTIEVAKVLEKTREATDPAGAAVEQLTTKRKNQPAGFGDRLPG